MNTPKLTIELVPKTSWYTNVRNKVSTDEWDKIRRSVYRKANYCCEICGGTGDKHPVECHEIWQYDDKEHVQKLTGMIALCPRCHQTKHYGLSQMRGLEVAVLEHMMKVNSWTIQEAVKYVEEVFKLWEQRSQHSWHVDISILEDCTK